MPRPGSHRRREQPPPRNRPYFRSGGATTLIFMVDGASAVSSLVMRSPMPWNIVDPPDMTTLEYHPLRIYYQKCPVRSTLCTPPQTTSTSPLLVPSPPPASSPAVVMTTTPLVARPPTRLSSLSVYYIIKCGDGGIFCKCAGVGRGPCGYRYRIS